MAKTAQSKKTRSQNGILAELTFQKPRRYSIQDMQTRLAGGESFFQSVYVLYMNRFITKADLVELIDAGLRNARGSYKTLVRDWNLKPTEYKKFLSFCRKHGVQVPYRPIRSLRVVPTPSSDPRKTSQPVGRLS